MLDPRLFTPSGLNTKFIGAGLTFSEYILAMQKIIAQARIDIVAANHEEILYCNSPFWWQPTLNHRINSKYRRGVILVHGLYDSPFIIMDIAQHLLAQGFLVCAVLLPGHGTVPGDLLNIQYSEWIRALDYGIEQLKHQVEQVYCAGFSLGGTLALHHAARDPDIAGLLLFAPALQLRAEHIVTLLPLLKLINWAKDSWKWYRQVPQADFVKYSSFPYNAAYQIYRAIKVKNALLAKNPLKIPLFLVITADDELIVPQSGVDFFSSYSNPLSKMIIYGNILHPSDPRIEQRSSSFPDLKILDFSHNCIATAADNRHYGIASHFQDFQHYPGGKPPLSSKKIFQGSIRPSNLARATIQRLSYNPDFDYMMAAMDEFLENIACQI